MADNLEISNFSIENTMEMGMGNQELLQGLFEPETASANPEDVTAIINDHYGDTSRMFEVGLETKAVKK